MNLRFAHFLLLVIGLPLGAFPQKARTIQEIVDSLFPNRSAGGCTIRVLTEAIPKRSLAGTRWDSSAIAGWLWMEDTCEPAMLHKSRNGNRDIAVETRTKNGDTTTIKTYYYWISNENELCSDDGRSQVAINGRGDTLYNAGSGAGTIDTYGTIDSIDNRMIRFGGEVAQVKAGCAGIVTVSMRKGKSEPIVNRSCDEIHVYGYSMLEPDDATKQLDTTSRQGKQVYDAIRKITKALKGMIFVFPADSSERHRHTTLYASKKECECEAKNRNIPSD